MEHATHRVSLIRRRTLIEGKWAKPSILSTQTITTARKQDSVSDVCRVSIMPTNIDDEKDEGVKVNEYISHEYITLRKSNVTYF